MTEQYPRPDWHFSPQKSQSQLSSFQAPPCPHSNKNCAWLVSPFLCLMIQVCVLTSMYNFCAAPGTRAYLPGSSHLPRAVWHPQPNNIYACPDSPSFGPFMQVRVLKRYMLKLRSSEWLSVLEHVYIRLCRLYCIPPNNIWVHPFHPCHPRNIGAYSSWFILLFCSSN